ncbi:hypothetical protein EJ08DRAFT_578881 [Tothia fuscella]|uniref:Uncharacterized protein n=1 Tax=Tothia fuscella TaxID=1048955 RepID=A0A9P4P154_9PEZI|nr:hypothetical protein EJ08DRAFT_578881 [Tothia fuscella]
MIMQPESRLISQEQLCAEVKSIYAGLTMVESKCIHVDKAQACTIRGADGKENRIADDHWQALIALHRTLLHEHHDFFLASQHPSASPALHRLATKYTMPPRMWKHGIHSFLELLRYRLPDSLDFMIKFIYTAYQMMSLLYETVPTFEDTWIECLGDLGRFKKYHSGAAASTNQKLGTEADRCEPLGELLRLARLSSPVTKTPIGKGHFTKKRAEYVVPGFVDSIYVPACADNGAGLNIMSEAFAKTHKFTINTTSRTSIRLPQGTFVKSMGVTTCIYQFAGETECHSISFAVLPNCVKDIILGRPFLSLTKTLTDFAHRIKKEFVNISSKLTRLLLMGSSDQRVRGTINGEQVLALPDTGSDIMILSKRYARSLGLTIQTEPEHRQWVELADGSQICTYGTVLDANWSYGYCTSKNLSYECDFHVLEDLECDVILSNEFLYDTHAFTSHEEHFIDFDDGAEDWSELRLFRLLYKTLKDEFPQLTEEELEHSRRAEADTYIANLPEVDRDAAQAIEDRLREEWDRNFVAATTTSSAPGAEHQSSGQVNSQGDSTLVSTIRRFHSRLFRRRKAHEAVKLTGVGG